MMPIVSFAAMPDPNSPISSPDSGVRSPLLPEVVDVSVVIVNYNVRDFLLQALQSVAAASENLSVETLVVDNNSVDGSVAAVMEQFPDVKLIANRENVGFGKANNIAIRQARGRYVLILNPDTIVREDTLEELVRFLDEHPDAGAAGCRIINPDGSFAPESRRSFPSPQVAFYRMTGLSRLFPRSRRFGRYNLGYLSEDEVAEIDALSGSCMMVRREALLPSREPGETQQKRTAAGVFDEDFFMYGEDLDLCYRIQRAGWGIFYVPSTEIIHYKGESTKKGELKYVRHFYGAMLLFIEKHFDAGQSGFVKWLLRTGIMLRAAIGYCHHHARNLAPVVLDFVIVYGTVTLLAHARVAALDRLLTPLFYGSVALGYAVATVGTTAMLGGYRKTAGFPLKAPLTGIVVGCLVAASLAFFIPATAFSRIVVAASLPLCGLFLASWRIRWHSRYGGPHDAVLVGDAAEAARLGRLLEAHPAPPFNLAGYVADPSPNGQHDSGPRRLGGVSQLRDLVRLNNVREIVFAARGIANHDIISLMRGLQDLTVQFRMLHEGSELVIGKSSVSPVSLSSLLAQLPEVVEIRSRARRRVFEVPLAIAGMMAWPFLKAASLLDGSGRLSAFTLRLRDLPSVLRGQRDLVGLDPEHVDLVPSSWGMKVGVFSITNTLNTQALDADEISRAYWYYATHQSPGTDLDIVFHSFKGRVST